MKTDEKFPIGCRVKVRAGPLEGTDRDWNGHVGTVVLHSHWIAVKMDKRRKDWKTDTPLLSSHNLVLETAQPAVAVLE